MKLDKKELEKKYKKLQKVRAINEKGYKHKGNLPAAACPNCGGWGKSGGMSHHYESNTPVMGRLGCGVGCGQG